MDENDIERIEINLLLDAIHQRYGYDFRCYARAAIDRRARELRRQQGCQTIAELLPRLLHDESLLDEIIRHFSITVTEMFRDPFVYKALREKVVPWLRTYPYLKIWVAGCATGEEVYSLAILLKEEGLYDRTTLYATDFNDAALARAREGIYELGRVREFAANYLAAGGTGALADYYHADYGAVAMRSELKKNITFANHNLTTDSVFGEMHLIVCRNVLIYFGKPLQARVLELFKESLPLGGTLCLGTKESLMFSEVADDFKVVDDRAKIYQKKGQ